MLWLYSIRNAFRIIHKGAHEIQKRKNNRKKKSKIKCGKRKSNRTYDHIVFAFHTRNLYG